MVPGSCCRIATDVLRAPRQALRIAKQVAYALLYLHGTAHVIHGDLKPSSVLFRSEDRSHLVLTDIAILKPLRSLGVRGVQQEDGPLFGRPASRSEVRYER